MPDRTAKTDCGALALRSSENFCVQKGLPRTRTPVDALAKSGGGVVAAVLARSSFSDRGAMM
jgi:hypothetical protein